MEKRATRRKVTETIRVEDIANAESNQRLYSRGHIENTSVKGILVVVNRKDLLYKDLNTSLSLEPLRGQNISFYIPQMDLEIDGKIGPTRHRGKGVFDIFIYFSSGTPTYWRECLMDLLPQPGELN